MSYLSDLFRNKRSEKLKTLAYQMGLEFNRKDEFKMIKRLGGFQLFGTGHSRKIVNLMVKEDDWLQSRYAIFDYQYTVQQGKSAITFKQTVFFMDSKKLGLPQFILKPEHFIHRIGKYLNFVQDIEIEEHPEFSKKYLVQSEHPEMLKDMVSPQIARFFNIENGWTLEGVNYFLILYKNKKRLPPETMKDFCTKGLRIVDLLEKENDMTDL